MNDIRNFIIKLPKDVYDNPENYMAYALANNIKSGISLNGKTNGEVVMALFPNETMYEETEISVYYGSMRFDAKWWKAPFKL